MVFPNTSSGRAPVDTYYQRLLRPRTRLYGSSEASKMRNPIYACGSCWPRMVLAAAFLLFIQRVTAIRCSICGQANLTAPGECTSQLQYDCLPNTANGGQTFSAQPPDLDQRQQPKILCRTTRTKLNENQFAVIKECVTENEHLNRYPDGKAFGCETVQSNSTYPTTYCVCDQDLCNSGSIDEQLRQPEPSLRSPEEVQSPPGTPDTVQQPQPQPQPAPIGINDQRRTVSQNPLQQPLLPAAAPHQRPEGPFIPALADTTPNPGTSQSPDLIQDEQGNAPDPNVQGHQPNDRALQQRRPGQNNATPSVLVALNTERVEFLTEGGSSLPSTKGPGSNKAGLVCIVCSQGNLSANQDCQAQEPVNCHDLFPGDSKLFCFSKSTTLSTGLSQIEKRCATEEQLVQETRLSVIEPSCFSGQDGYERTDYCVCDTDKCNQLPISNQANMYPPLTANDGVGQQPTGNTGHNLGLSANSSLPSQQTKMCYVCGESDQAHPGDCTQQYQYDCTRQYPQRPTILCLTRLTKVATDRYNIEKRCITPAEHQLQYPGNEVTLDGCSDAWNGYVQYCVCEGDFCNAQNISAQQQTRQWTTSSAKSTEEKETESAVVETRGQDAIPSSSQVPPNHQDSQRQPATPALQNGLLEPPSTRLSLSYSSYHVATTTESHQMDNKSAVLSGGDVQQSIPPSTGNTSATPTSPWVSQGRHRPENASTHQNSSQKHGQTVPRHGSNSRVAAENDPSSSKGPTTYSSGFLHSLALSVLTVLVMNDSL